MKKTWNKPQLVVLVRSKTEEAVLVTCKSGQAGGGAALNGSPSTTFLICTRVPVSGLAGANCANCDSLALS
jgi:hypothetical protein